MCRLFCCLGFSHTTGLAVCESLQVVCLQDDSVQLCCRQPVSVQLRRAVITPKVIGKDLQLRCAI